MFQIDNDGGDYDNKIGGNKIRDNSLLSLGVLRFNP